MFFINGKRGKYLLYQKGLLYLEWGNGLNPQVKELKSTTYKIKKENMAHHVKNKDLRDMALQQRIVADQQQSQPE